MTGNSYHDVHLVNHGTKMRVMCENDYKDFKVGQVYDTVKNGSDYIISREDGQKIKLNEVAFEAFFYSIKTLY